MNRRIAIRNLQFITTLDSISFGLFYRHNGAYIQGLGGGFVSEGFMVTGLVIGELLSPDITNIIARANGKKFALMATLIIAFLTHFLTIISKSLWVFIIARILFSLTHNTKRFCRDLLLEKDLNLETRGRLLMNFAFLDGSGYVLGPIIGGYLLIRSPNYLAIGATFLVLLCIILLAAVNTDDDAVYPRLSNSDLKSVNNNEISLFGKLGRLFLEAFQRLKQCDLKTNWDVLALKFLFASSMSIFFGQFRHLLTLNCNILSVVTRGYTISYLNSLVYATSWYLSQAKSRLTHRFPLKLLTEVTFFLIAAVSLLICSAPCYRLFMLLGIPFVLLRTLITFFWSDIFSERANRALEQLEKSAEVLACLTMPLLLGVTCKKIGMVGVAVFTCVPLVLCWLIIRFYTRVLKFEVQEDGDCNYGINSNSKMA